MSTTPAAPQAAPNAATRPLDTFATLVVIGLCLSWGFNQVSIKLALADVPPMTQAAIRSSIATVIVFLWVTWRGLPLFARDGSLWPGIACGVLFAMEFVLMYLGLQYTVASRAALFLYLAPFFVVIGLRWVVPADGFRVQQWIGLLLSFAGMAVAFGTADASAGAAQLLGDVLTVGAALFWALTTLLIKGSVMNRISSEKTLLYQVGISVPILAAGALIAGERITGMPSATALVAMAYQSLYVVPVTFGIWFALIVRYSAGRLSAFTFLTPLFGVAAGHFVLGDPITPAFALAVALVTVGLILVNRAR